MKKEDKSQIISDLAERLANNKHFYLADTSAMPSAKTSKLRRMCYQKNIQMVVVKNTLLRKALERTNDTEFSPLYATLKGATSILFAETANEPAKLIKEFRKAEKVEKPILKAAYVEESIYIGNDQLDALSAIKSKNEMIGEVIGLLQSPAKNVISALQGSAGQKIAGLVKTLSERPE